MAKKAKAVAAADAAQIWDRPEKAEVYVGKGVIDWSKAPRFCVNPNRRITIKVV